MHKLKMNIRNEDDSWIVNMIQYVLDQCVVEFTSVRWVY